MKMILTLITVATLTGCATLDTSTSRIQPHVIDETMPGFVWAATFGPGEPPQAEVMEDRGLIGRSVDWVKENPWQAAAVTVGAYIVYDQFIDTGSGGSQSNSDTIIVHAGRDASVTFTQTDRSNNDSSNRPATAQPFFPPPQ
jgi:hypothetical protein